jgi:hypothetical protein
LVRLRPEEEAEVVCNFHQEEVAEVAEAACTK